MDGSIFSAFYMSRISGRSFVFVRKCESWQRFCLPKRMAELLSLELLEPILDVLGRIAIMQIGKIAKMQAAITTLKVHSKVKTIAFLQN